MAAWLAYLKSTLLLPRDPEVEPDPEDLALRLQLRLERLDAMRDAGARLMARDRTGRDVFTRGAPEGLHVVRKAFWSVEYYDLLSAYGRATARSRPVLHVVRDREVVTLEAALARLSALLGTALQWRAIEHFLPEVRGAALRRSALASSFLAALELARQGRAELQQDAAFAPLYLRRSAP
jgi:segregation and condensation protein A